MKERVNNATWLKRSLRVKNRWAIVASSCVVVERSTDEIPLGTVLVKLNNSRSLVKKNILVYELDEIAESITIGGLKMPLLPLKDSELYYEVHGRGQPMLFLSETACDGEVWKIYQVEEFSRDHQVILHDYRGTGRSGKPSIDYSTKMFCDDAATLLNHLGAEKAIVVGHSMGGRIAQLLTLEYPEKVDKLILASTGAAFPTTKGLPLKICKEMIEWGYEKYVRDHSILVGFTDEFAQKYPERVEKYLQVRMANLCPVEFYLRHLIARQSHDTTGRLRDIRVPTLILVGEDDRNVTSDINHRSSSEILAQGIANSKLVVLPGERHSYFFANPDAAHLTIREFIKSSR